MINDIKRDITLDLIQEAVHELIAKKVGKSIEELSMRFSVESVDSCNSVDTGMQKFLGTVFKGRCQLVVNASQYSDEDNSFQDYRSDVLTNPSWLDLAVCFEKSISVTGDISHIYFEDFSEGGDIDGVRQLVAFAGS